MWHACDLASRETYHSTTFPTKYVNVTALGAMKTQRLTAWPMSRSFFVYLLLAIKLYSWPQLHALPHTNCTTTWHQPRVRKIILYRLPTKAICYFGIRREFMICDSFDHGEKWITPSFFCVLNLFFWSATSVPHTIYVAWHRISESGGLISTHSY